MSLKELAIVNKKDKHYEFSSNFDGVTHVLRLDYNERNDTWHLTLKNADAQCRDEKKKTTT